MFGSVSHFAREISIVLRDPACTKAGTPATVMSLLLEASSQHDPSSSGENAPLAVLLELMHCLDHSVLENDPKGMVDFAATTVQLVSKSMNDVESTFSEFVALLGPGCAVLQGVAHAIESAQEFGNYGEGELSWISQCKPSLSSALGRLLELQALLRDTRSAGSDGGKAKSALEEQVQNAATSILDCGIAAPAWARAKTKSAASTSTTSESDVNTQGRESSVPEAGRTMIPSAVME